MDLPPAHFFKDEMQNRRLIVNGLIIIIRQSSCKFVTWTNQQFLFLHSLIVMLNCFSTPRTVWWLDGSRLQRYVQFGAKHDQMRQNNHIVYKGKQLFIFMKLNPSIYGANKLTKKLEASLILYLKPLTVAHGLDMIWNQYIVHYFSIWLL